MQKLVKIAGGVLFAALLVMVWGPSTHAQKDFIKKVRRDYQLDPRVTGKCTLCHSPDEAKKEKPDEDNLNAFGLAVHDHADMKPLLGKSDDHKFTKAELVILTKVVKALENTDTDGDGATNGEELALDTFPGDKTSTPTKKKLDKHRKKKAKK